MGLNMVRSFTIYGQRDYQPSLNEVSSNLMFLRAGGAAIKRTTAAIISQAIISQAINQLAPALSPSVTLLTSQADHSSLAKVINNQLRCYEQLVELKNLMQAKSLSDEEYNYEREANMGTL